MKTATVLFVLAFIALAGVALAQRQDEALDSLMLSSNLQPVNDPIPRLLQEALESAAATPGSYGSGVTPGPITTASTPAAQKSSSSSAAAGVVSLLAAVAAAAMML